MKRIVKRVLFSGIRLFKKITFLRKSKKSKGKYYVIKPDNTETGLFSYFNVFLPQMLMAKTAGWSPIVDMQNVNNTYLEPSQIGKENAWEFYFEQDRGLQLKNIEGEKIVNKSFEPFRNGPYSGRAFFENWYGEKTFWRKYVAKEIVVRREILNSVNSWWAKSTRDNDRVLGVLVRGTDYLRLKPTGHARQPEPEQCVKKTKELLKTWNCNRVYLCTEDQQILDLFESEFNNQIIFYNKPYVLDTGNGYVTQVHFDRLDDKKKQGEEYLIQILLLSRCTCLLAGPCGGTIGAELFTKGFEREYIWDLGLYS